MFVGHMWKMSRPEEMSSRRVPPRQSLVPLCRHPLIGNAIRNCWWSRPAEVYELAVADDIGWQIGDGLPLLDQQTE
jgi:hypothetical protein